MIRLPGGQATENPQDKSLERFKEHVYENSQQKIMILDDAPTAAIPIIIEGQIGSHSGNNKIYFVIGGVLKEFSTSDTA